jgi:leucyl aminopeptidase (aminopeptidase T)
MSYQQKNNQIWEEMGERMELVAERLTQIAEGTENGAVSAPGTETFGAAAGIADAEELGAFFKAVSSYLLLQWEIAQKANQGALDTLSAAEGKSYNDGLYLPFFKENYMTSFANPAFAVQALGADNGTLLAAIFTKIAHLNLDVFEGNIRFLCIYAELVVELYNCFEDPEVTQNEIKSCVYSFMHDYSELFDEDRIQRLLNPDWDYAAKLLMEADLSDPAYLYRYGRFVGENEIKSAQYLNTFSEEEIQAMADTYTEGYRIGFETTGKDLSIKSVVDVRYPLGFERMVRKAVSNFAKLNLRPVLAPFSTSVNKQFDYDHKEDAALWMDKAYVERNLECFRSAFEACKEIAPGYGGPAVIEVFGEEPFSPESKPENPRFSEKQQKLAVYQQSEFSQMLNSYIHGEERSFTIIAYPLPSIGAQYEAIFAETVKINTLDYVLYRDMQQKIIDVLDTADRVHIVGTNGNRTDLYVKIYDLTDPAKETAFENCVADVNIPVGEVFTSPVLAGTTGKLHVSQVYLNELNYKNLEIDFKDGMIAQYTCTNFSDEAENKKYIEDNVLMHHETLPMGEFAIGTNTTAFRMARVFDIADKMPILIAEKTGPHFAVGDTCYTYDEDNMTYNPDGKAIVARDNAVSILRKTDISKAYFNCHTDITIPYDELGAITVIRKDGSTQDIIRNGRFVVPGTEELNKPLELLEEESR